MDTGAHHQIWATILLQQFYISSLHIALAYIPSILSSSVTGRGLKQFVNDSNVMNVDKTMDIFDEFLYNSMHFTIMFSSKMYLMCTTITFISNDLQQLHSKLQVKNIF